MDNEHLPASETPDRPRCTCGHSQSDHEAVHVRVGAFEACIDRGMVPLVSALWQAGFPTGESCEFHDFDPHAGPVAFLSVPAETLGLIGSAVMEASGEDDYEYQAEDAALRLLGNPWRQQWEDQWPAAEVTYATGRWTPGEPLEVSVCLFPPVAELPALTDTIRAWVERWVPEPPAVEFPYGCAG